MSTFRPDAGIPLLTEIIDIPTLSEQDVLPVVSATPVSPPPPSLLPSPPPATTVAEQRMTDPEHWARLEHELHEKILQQVLKHIDSALEQRVRDSLADVLQVAVDRLAADLRSGLQQTVREVVTSAVRTELDIARSSKK